MTVPAPPVSPPPSSASRLHASRPVRCLLWAAGSIALVLGIIGVFLPVLPTTPFILLAAACYAKASERLHQRLLAHPSFGPMVRDWEEYRSLSLRTKKVAISLMTLSISGSIWVVREHPGLQAMLALIAVSVGSWLWRLPSRDAAGPDAGEGQKVSAPSTPEDVFR